MGDSLVLKDNFQDAFFENLIEWLSVKDAAIYLRKFKADGQPSLGAIRNLLYRKKIRAKKFFGRVLINRRELDSLIENSPDY